MNFNYNAQKEDLIPHKLYLVILSGSTELFGKVGITSKESTVDRFADVTNYKVICGYEFNCTDAVQARGIESILTSKIIPHNKLKYVPKLFLYGYSECFYADVIEDLAELIVEQFGLPFKSFDLTLREKPITMAEYYRKNPRSDEEGLPDWMEYGGPEDL